MTTVEFGSKDAADAIREEYPDALCPDDDRRLKTVRFSSEAPDHALEDALRRADQSRADAESGPGQLELTDHEKDRIDFSVGHASVPHARSVKAIARSEGVDDWLAYYDPSLRVDEHRDVMAQATRDESGRQMDARESATARAGRAAATAEGEQCDHARDHCEHGDQDACAFLRRSCGFDDDEVADILGADEPETLPGRVYGALRQLWQRYKIGVVNAKEAAAAINELNAQHGRELVSFEELGDRELRKAHLDWEPTA